MSSVRGAAEETRVSTLGARVTRVRSSEEATWQQGEIALLASVLVACRVQQRGLLKGQENGTLVCGKT